MSALPLRIACGGRDLYAMLYGSGGDLALILPPLAEERKGAVRPLAEWARKRASQGSAALFFDYGGCGESPGDFSSVTWQSLREDAGAALQIARARAGGRPVACLACRLAARLAVEIAAAQPETVRKLCLWDPVFDGQLWLRELRRRSRFRGSGVIISEAGEDIDGTFIGRRFIEDLENMRGLPPAPPCPVLMIAFANRSAPPAISEAAAQWRAELECVAMPSFWQESDPPCAETLFAHTMAWLSAAPHK